MRLYTTTLPAAHPRAGRWRQGLGRAQFTCRSKAALVAEGRAGRQCPTGGDGGAAAASAAAAGVLPLGAVRLEAPGEVDMLVFDVHQGELAHRLENAVHLGQRWEHRLQRRAAALPVGARRLLAGGIAGACGKTSTAPLETVKMQLVAGHKGAWEAAAAIWRRGGAAAFFKGNTVDVLRTIPSRAIELSCYESLKKTFRRWNRKHSGELHIPDQLVATLAGGLAGVAASIAVYPLETARTRLALGTVQGNFGFTAIRTIARQEGAAALFKGLDASLVGVIPYAALRLGSYDALKAVWRRKTGRKDIEPQMALLFGALAGCLSSTLTYPVEVTRRRMMAGAAYPHMVAAARGIVAAEGVGALFNGVLLGLAKQGPQMAITFCSYEMAKQFLEL